MKSCLERFPVDKESHATDPEDMNLERLRTDAADSIRGATSLRAAYYYTYSIARTGTD